MPLGVIELNGSPVALTNARYSIAFEASDGQEHQQPAETSVKLSVETYDNFARVVMTSEDLDLSVDLGAPPDAWQLPANSAAAAQYTHLNVHMARVSASSAIHGLIGVSARLKTDANGEPILHGLDKNGAGILDGAVEDYEVSGILDPDFEYSVFQSS